MAAVGGAFVLLLIFIVLLAKRKRRVNQQRRFLEWSIKGGAPVSEARTSLSYDNSSFPFSQNHSQPMNRRSKLNPGSDIVALDMLDDEDTRGSERKVQSRAHLFPNIQESAMNHRMKENSSGMNMDGDSDMAAAADCPAMHFLADVPISAPALQDSSFLQSPSGGKISGYEQISESTEDKIYGVNGVRGLTEKGGAILPGDQSERIGNREERAKKTNELAHHEEPEYAFWPEEHGDAKMVIPDRGNIGVRKGGIYGSARLTVKAAESSSMPEALSPHNTFYSALSNFDEVSAPSVSAYDTPQGIKYSSDVGSAGDCSQVLAEERMPDSLYCAIGDKPNQQNEVEDVYSVARPIKQVVSRQNRSPPSLPPLLPQGQRVQLKLTPEQLRDLTYMPTPRPREGDVYSVPKKSSSKSTVDAGGVMTLQNESWSAHKDHLYSSIDDAQREEEESVSNYYQSKLLDFSPFDEQTA